MNAILTTAIFFTLLLCSTLFTANAQELRSRPTADTSASQSLIVQASRDELLKVNIVSTKPEYLINEAIQFTLSSNEDIYLYLFAVSSQGTSHLIFPVADGTKLSGNKIPANTKMQLPEKGFEIVGQVVSEQTIVSVASVKPIDWDFSKKELGSSGIDTQDLKAKIQRLEEYSQRNSRRRAAASDSTTQSDWNMQSATLHIQQIQASIVDSINLQDAPETATANNSTQQDSRPVIMVNSDKNVYKIGEKASLHFAATHSGYAHIFIAQPKMRAGAQISLNGHSELLYLSSQPLGSKTFQSIEAEVTAPTGMHAVLVVYSEQEEIDTNKIVRLYNTHITTEMKGLRLEDSTQPLVLAISHFNIIE